MPGQSDLSGLYEPLHEAEDNHENGEPKENSTLV
jgi:hypothetical protein